MFLPSEVHTQVDQQTISVPDTSLQVFIPTERNGLQFIKNTVCGCHYLEPRSFMGEPLHVQKTSLKGLVPV